MAHDTAHCAALTRRHLLSLGLGLGAGATLAWAGPARAGDAPTHPVALHDLDWRDASRRRAVPALLYWPEGAAGPVPLMVFSHGLFGTRQGYSYLGRHVAERGVASLHLQHVGSDRSLWGDNVLVRFARVLKAAGEGEAIARVHDLRFALDQVLAHAEFGPRIDRRRIVAAGHSYGANTAMLAGGARVVREGQALGLRATSGCARCCCCRPRRSTARPTWTPCCARCGCPRCTSPTPRT